ncbi:MAG: SUMF1/EgtB/PvdO family nonheme iron enzyme [Hyphomicrobiaceae bacterium]
MCPNFPRRSDAPNLNGAISRKHIAAARSAKAVGKSAREASGLRHMNGNVWEWCEDTRHPDDNGALLGWFV